MFCALAILYLTSWCSSWKKTAAHAAIFVSRVQNTFHYDDPSMKPRLSADSHYLTTSSPDLQQSHTRSWLVGWTHGFPGQLRPWWKL